MIKYYKIPFHPQSWNQPVFTYYKVEDYRCYRYQIIYTLNQDGTHGSYNQGWEEIKTDNWFKPPRLEEKFEITEEEMFLEIL